MGSEKLPQDNQEDRRERREDCAGQTVKLLSMKQKKMSGEATDGQCLRDSRWGWVAKGDKAHLMLCKFPSDVSRYKDTVLIKQVMRCRSPLPEGNPVPWGGGEPWGDQVIWQRLPHTHSDP